MSTPENNGPAATAVSRATQDLITPLQETPASSGPSGAFAAPPPRSKWASATYLLIIANTVVFYAMLAHSIHSTGLERFLNTRIFENFDAQLLRTWGSDFGPLTLSGQFWRVFTSMFVHLNFLHLAVNMLFLWGLGRYMDRLFSRAQSFAIYLLTGVAGDIVSLGWHPLINSLGSSGAIYGQAGVLIALLCFGRLALPRRDIRNLVLWIIFLMPIELLWSPLSKHTDYAAHVGGILGGFVIGVLLAPAFRAPIERAGWQPRVLRLTAVAMVICFVGVAQARRGPALEYLKEPDFTIGSYTNYFNRPPEIARVFLDLKGDPKLVRYFSGLLHAELENDGIAVTSSAPEADAVVHGEVHPQTKQKNLGLGVVQMHINSEHGLEKLDSCATLSTNENGNFFDQYAARNAAGKLRGHYPDARKLRLDPANDLSASSQFAAELPSALKKSDFTVVQSGPADITVHIALVPQKVPVDEDMAVYNIRVVARDGALISEHNGSRVLLAKLAGQAPDACPDHLADLKWVYNSDMFYSTVSDVANDLYIPQTKKGGNKGTSKSKP
jgi:membrane associated rhomboid family serine protease